MTIYFLNPLCKIIYLTNIPCLLLGYIFFEVQKIYTHLDLGKGRRKLKLFLPNNTGKNNNSIMIIGSYHLFIITIAMHLLSMSHALMHYLISLCKVLVLLIGSDCFRGRMDTTWNKEAIVQL